MPPRFAFVSYEPVPGWKVDVKRKKLAKPIEAGHGEKVSEVVSQVTWTGDGKTGIVKPGQFQDFGLSVGVPDGKAGSKLTFKALQTYQGGKVVRWIGAPDADKPARAGHADRARGRAAARTRPRTRRRPTRRPPAPPRRTPMTTTAAPRPVWSSSRWSWAPRAWPPGVRPGAGAAEGDVRRRLAILAGVAAAAVAVVVALVLAGGDGPAPRPRAAAWPASPRRGRCWGASLRTAPRSASAARR